MGDFNAKVGKKQAGDHAMGEYGIVSGNAKGELLLLELTKRSIRILNTFIRKWANRKWVLMAKLKMK